MNIPNEEHLGKIIRFYNGLNFKSKFNLSSEEYKYLRTKYKVARLVPRSARLCWKCDMNFVSQTVLSTNMCDSCYNTNIKQYFLSYNRILPAAETNQPLIFKAYKGVLNDLKR